MRTTCKHQRKVVVGDSYSATSIKGGQILVYWCPLCGSIGRKIMGARYANWEKPTGCSR